MTPAPLFRYPVAATHTRERKVVAAGPQSDARADLRPAAGAIEIVLGDASVRVVKGVDTATLSRVLAAVRGGRA